MDVSSASGIVGFKAAMTKQQIQMAVLTKTMDVAKSQGEAAAELLDSASEPAAEAQSEQNGGVDLTV